MAAANVGGINADEGNMYGISMEYVWNKYGCCTRVHTMIQLTVVLLNLKTKCTASSLTPRICPSSTLLSSGHTSGIPHPHPGPAMAPHPHPGPAMISLGRP